MFKTWVAKVWLSIAAFCGQINNIWRSCSQFLYIKRSCRELNYSTSMPKYNRAINIEYYPRNTWADHGPACLKWPTGLEHCIKIWIFIDVVMWCSPGLGPKPCQMKKKKRSESSLILLRKIMSSFCIKSLRVIKWKKITMRWKSKASKKLKSHKN